MRHVLYLFFLCISVTALAQDDHMLTVEFDGIKTEKGKLFVALYDSEANFLKRPIHKIIVEINDGKAATVFSNLKPGIYAISSFFDQNNNGKMDTNFIGIPKEPTAMSNNAKGSFGPPKFKDAKFGITTLKTLIKINY